MNIDNCLEEFTKYVSNYNMKSSNIKLKYTHSVRVMKLMGEIAVKLKLNEEEIFIAKLIGLLHDIGRFEQITEFKSFKDVNMDHGEYGAKILFEDGLIRRFIDFDKYDDVIKKSIQEHNKHKVVEEGMSTKEILYVEMIRDADKIDIFKVLRLKKWSGFIVKPNKEVVDKFLEKETISNDICKNGSDTTIGRMAFLYDINYKESFEVLREKKYLEKWLESVKVSDIEQEEFEKFKNISLDKLKEGV